VRETRRAAAPAMAEARDLEHFQQKWAPVLQP